MSAADDLRALIGKTIDLKGGGNVTFYDGNEDQEPPAAIEGVDGVGNTSGYRGTFLAVFTNFPLPQRPARINQLSFEYVAEHPPDRSIANQCGAQIVHLLTRFQRE